MIALFNPKPTIYNKIDSPYETIDLQIFNTHYITVTCIKIMYVRLFVLNFVLNVEN